MLPLLWRSRLFERIGGFYSSLDELSDEIVLTLIRRSSLLYIF